jgi:hypothetical protein
LLQLSDAGLLLQPLRTLRRHLQLQELQVGGLTGGAVRGVYHRSP